MTETSRIYCGGWQQLRAAFFLELLEQVLEKLYQVFISSTYTDLVEERAKVKDAVSKSGHVPAGMESFPASNQKQLPFIKRIIDRCDYYVLIIGGRYGSLNGLNISYTEAEYEYAEQIGLPILTFLHQHPDKIESGKTDQIPELAQKLASFRARVTEGRVVDYWNSAHELATKVTVALSQEMNLNPRIGWVRGDKALDAETFRELEELRKESVTLKQNSKENEFIFPEWMPNINELFEVNIKCYRNPYTTEFGTRGYRDETIEKLQISTKELFVYVFQSIRSGLVDHNIDSEFSVRLLPLLKKNDPTIKDIHIITTDSVALVDRLLGFELIEEFSHGIGEKNILRRHIRLTTLGQKFGIKAMFASGVSE